MPATFEIDEGQRLVRSRAWGVLVDTDLQSTQQGLRDDPRFGPTYRQIWDFRDVTDVQLTGDGVRELARNSPFAPHARRAVLVGSDVAYGMARMYAILSDRHDDAFHVFRDPVEALRWLNLDESPDD